MDWKKIVIAAGIIAGVFLGMKYVFPVILPFLFGWILAEMVHPAAAYLAGGRICRKLHVTESGIGAGIILALTLGAVGCILIGAEYLTGKMEDCVKYYPMLKTEAGRILEKCCVKAEHITGIPARESIAYLCEQFHHAGEYFWTDGKGMDTAVDTVKWCIAAAGMIIVTVVSSILFLQEREKIRTLVEKRNFYQRIRELIRELSEGTRAYLKAQIKIMGIVSALCIMGLWILKVRNFLGLGVLIGILDAFPILGTGTFLIPGGIILLLRGNTVMGGGFFVLYLITSGVRQLLEPRLIGSHVGISPLMVLLFVYLGVIVYGCFGFILGPLSGFLLYAVFKEWDLLHK